MLLGGDCVQIDFHARVYIYQMDVRLAMHHILSWGLRHVKLPTSQVSYRMNLA
jgi:hypothetical protein